ncbi:HAD family hydrolase [Chitinophaga agri]|uniref:HAD family hydrolase n=1 Tax=Chitinophaga agri TaxID=2703787 RepID=A0A6B9ZNI7_9BACT|nr:HAD family hydrolase [Chitinophaga agri]QHS63449.1 HAD family hydrolase [Chitinophaga agri]
MLNNPVLIFDLDNTLFDRNRAMRQAMQCWLRQHPEVSHTLDEVMAQDAGGNTDRTAFCQWLMPAAAPDTLLRSIQQLIIGSLRPDAAIRQLLEQLQRRYQLVLASNGNGTIQRLKLAACGLTACFQHIFISGEMGKAKPNPEFFREILKTLAISPAQACMIGDDLVNDILGAQACGLNTCWVAYGETSDRNNPAIVIQHITELHRWTEC